MLGYLALVDNSDSGSLGIGILLMFIFIALTIAIPALLLGWIFFRLILDTNVKSSKNNSTAQTMPKYLPYLVGGIGVLIILANIGGSKYSDRSILFDSILLAMPFLLGLVASLQSVKPNTRKILLVAIFFSTLIFMSYHYLD